jgi:flagellar biosynthesis protein FliQ
MLSLSSMPLQVFALIVGVFSHLTYFIHGEHLTNIPKLLAVVFFAQCALLFFLNAMYGFSKLSALSILFRLSASYAVGVWTSMLIYRIFFHPLKNWPGPFAARITQFHRVFQVRKLDQYRYLQSLHNRYGDFVRIGMSRDAGLTRVSDRAR